MSQYHHLFSCLEQTDTYCLYRAENLFARVDFLGRALLRVSILPQGERLLPTYSVCPDGIMPHEGRDRLSLAGFSGFTPAHSGAFSFVWDAYSLTIEPENFLLQLTKNGRPLLRDRAPQSYNLGGEFGETQRHYLVREADERIYGLGDKSGALNKAGRRFRLDSKDALGYDAETGDPLYQHVPFYICQNSAGFVGLFYDTHSTCAFDFGAELSNYTGPYRVAEIGENALVYYILLGSLPEIVTGFSALTGKTALLPRRSLLYAGSTMTYTDAPDADAQLRAFADACGTRGFSCGGFYLSSGYTSIENRRYVFHWNNEKIPDPKALSAYFSARGIDLIANIKPVFLTDHPLYGEIAANGWFLSNPDGSPALTPFWDGLGSWLDFTNPGAYEFWKAQVTHQLLENGICCTWNDNNEYEVLDPRIIACGFGAPYSARRMKPTFAMLMTMASLEAQRAYFGAKKRQLLSSRAGAAGICRMAMIWTGDNQTSWKTLRYNHFMGLTLSLSGLFLFGHDICGFVGLAPERELFLRWLQHGALTPRFVIHSWNDDNRATTPWLYPDAEPAARAIFAFRQRILPYLYDAMYRAHTLGEPILRPLLYDDPAADPESELFFVGDSLLAACAFREGVSRLNLRLPRCENGWYLQDGAWLRENAETTLDCPLDGAPTVLYRGGSMFVSDSAAYPNTGEPQPLFTVYAAESGQFERTFFLDDGETNAYLNGECVQIRFSIHCEADRVCVCYQNLAAHALLPNVTLVDRLNRPLTLAPFPDA